MKVTLSGLILLWKVEVMFIFSKVKFSFALMCYTLFMAGMSAGLAFDGRWEHWLFVPIQLVASCLAFWSMSTRLSVQVARTSEIICAEQQAKLIVSMFDSGNLLDPDFVPVVELSRKVLEDLEEVRRG